MEACEQFIDTNIMIIDINRQTIDSAIECHIDLTLYNVSIPSFYYTPGFDVGRPLSCEIPQNCEVRKCASAQKRKKTNIIHEALHMTVGGWVTSSCDRTAPLGSLSNTLQLQASSRAWQLSRLLVMCVFHCDTFERDKSAGGHGPR